MTVIGGPPFIGHCDGITRLEVVDEEGGAYTANGIRVVLALVDDGQTLKVIVRGGD